MQETGVRLSRKMSARNSGKSSAPSSGATKSFANFDLPAAESRTAQLTVKHTQSACVCEIQVRDDAGNTFVEFK